MCLRATNTAEVLDKSGLTTCNVMETRCHYRNVDIVAGVFITVVTMKTCQLLATATVHVSVDELFSPSAAIKNRSTVTAF